MHEFISSGISPQRYAIFDRRNDFKKINSKTGFQNRKPDFGFQTENRISGFRLTSLAAIPLFRHQEPSSNGRGGRRASAEAVFVADTHVLRRLFPPIPQMHYFLHPHSFRQRMITISRVLFKPKVKQFCQ